MGPAQVEDHQVDFTEDHYGHLLRQAKAQYRFASFDEYDSSERIVVWRHDVDLSAHRAYRLSQIEAEAGVIATYFIHLHSEFYHWGEKLTSDLIQKIQSFGHHLGLHFDPSYYMGSINNENDLVTYLLREKGMLEREFGKIRAFSLHNPDVGGQWLQYDKDVLAGMVNTYGRTISENFTYCSDSNGYWRHSRLNDLLKMGNEERLHVLTHPGWWQEVPMSPMDRIDHCIDRRSESVRSRYVNFMRENGRRNIGHDEVGN